MFCDFNQHVCFLILINMFVPILCKGRVLRFLSTCLYLFNERFMFCDFNQHVCFLILINMFVPILCKGRVLRF
jgi:ABC-type cobalamin transport system permease subunit